MSHHHSLDGVRASLSLKGLSRNVVIVSQKGYEDWFFSSMELASTYTYR